MVVACIILSLLVVELGKSPMELRVETLAAAATIVLKRRHASLKANEEHGRSPRKKNDRAITRCRVLDQSLSRKSTRPQVSSSEVNRPLPARLSESAHQRKDDVLQVCHSVPQP